MQNVKKKMPIVFSVIVLLCLSQTLFAQYTSRNSLRCRAIVKYEQDSLGFYHQKENVEQVSVENTVSIYAFDKTTSNLYVIADKGNYEITLLKDVAKAIKKDKTIPKLQGKDLATVITTVNLNLATHFANANALLKKELEIVRQKHILDSINRVRELEQLKRDSLKRLEEYISNHKWFQVPIGGKRIKCLEEGCGNSISEDIIDCMAIKGDTLYYVADESLPLGFHCRNLHLAKVPKEIQNSVEYRYHVSVFKDSLRKIDLTPEYVNYHNAENLEEAVLKIRRAAPYGFFEEWGWDDEFSVSFYCTYRNLSKKTIKYIQVFWRIKNAVGDIRKTGYFSGTGPVESEESGSWKWEHSSYYVAGDATQMELTKVILTYTDGTKKVLTGDMIVTDTSQ